MKAIAPLMVLALVACRKDEPSPASVELSVICQHCTFEYTVGDHGGSGVLDTIADIAISDAVQFTALPGDAMRVRATPSRASRHAVMVVAKVNGFQQAMEYYQPLPPNDTTRTVEISTVVPELDRYGDPQ